MDKQFTCGLILGMIGGALLIANSYKARKFIKDGQQQLKEKMSDIGKKESDNYDELSD